jgi:hypothetical protein
MNTREKREQRKERNAIVLFLFLLCYVCFLPFISSCRSFATIHEISGNYLNNWTFAKRQVNAN